MMSIFYVHICSFVKQRYGRRREGSPDYPCGRYGDQGCRRRWRRREIPAVAGCGSGILRVTPLPSAGRGYDPTGFDRLFVACGSGLRGLRVPLRETRR